MVQSNNSGTRSSLEPELNRERADHSSGTSGGRSRDNRRHRRIIMTGAALLALALMTFAVLRYDLPYLLRQGAAMLEARSGMRKISELRESGELDESTRRFFSLVGEIRNYAVGELGLRETESYTSYVEIDKDHIVDVVSAVRSDSLRRYEKYYPIVGTVFYRGYFDRRGAERFAARLEERGYDVIIREVDAYSSLGFLSDPLYSFMRSYSDYRLAEMIIHEMVHSTLWIPNRNEFNEEIASFIGREGAIDFIRNRRGADTARLEEIRHLRRDYERLVEFFTSLYERLERRYAEYPGPEHKEKRLEIKRREIEEAKRSFRRRYDELFLTDSYEYVAELEWNHAFIDLYVQYGGDLSLYYRLLDACGGDIAEATELILSVEEETEEPREEIRRLLSSYSTNPAASLKTQVSPDIPYNM